MAEAVDLIVSLSPKLLTSRSVGEIGDAPKSTHRGNRDVEMCNVWKRTPDFQFLAQPPFAETPRTLVSRHHFDIEAEEKTRDCTARGFTLTSGAIAMDHLYLPAFFSPS